MQPVHKWHDFGIRSILVSVCGLKSIWQITIEPALVALMETACVDSDKVKCKYAKCNLKTNQLLCDNSQAKYLHSYAIVCFQR